MDALLRAEIFCRSALGRAPGPAGGRAELFAEGSGGAARLPPPGARHQRHARRAGLRGAGWTSRAAARLDEIAAYNEEDCRATLALRDWLVEHRPEDVGLGRAPGGAARRRRQAEDRRPARGAAPGAARRAPRPARRAGWRPSCSSTTGARPGPAWWWFFARCQMSARRAGRRRRGDRPAGAARARRDRVKSSLDHRFRFPPQQHKLAPGDTPVDPATGKAAGTIVEIDEATGELVLRRGPSPHPSRCRRR